MGEIDTDGKKVNALPTPALNQGLEALAEWAMAPMLLAAPSLQVEWVNRAFLALVGSRNSPAWEGKPLPEIFGPLGKELASIVRIVVNQARHYWPREVSLECPELSSLPRVFLLSGIPVGSPVAHVGLIVRDITEQVQLARSLRDSEERFRQLARLMPGALFHADTRGNFLSVGEGWTELTGLTPKEALGIGWMRAIGAPDRARFFWEWQTAVQAELPFSAELVLECETTGRRIPARMQALVEKRQGVTQGYFGVILARKA